MTTPKRWGCGAILGIGVAWAGAASAVDVTGNEARFQWTPSSGIVQFYAVRVSRDGAPPVEEGITTDPEVVVRGDAGETIQVEVQGLNLSGGQSEWSLPSVEVTFLGAPPPPPPEEEPPPPPPEEEPPPPPPEEDPPPPPPEEDPPPPPPEEDPPPPPPEEDPPPPPPEEDPPVADRTLLDFDGDGAADLFYVDAWRRRLSTLGESAIDAGKLQRIAKVVGSADHDGDGRADVLIEYPRIRPDYVRRLELRLLGPDGVRESAFISDSIPSGWYVSGSADLDGDGRADVLLSKRRTGEVDAWLMRGTEVAEVIALPLAAEGTRIVGVGDHDGNGQHDVLFEVPTDRGQSALVAWLLFGDGLEVEEVVLFEGIEEGTPVGACDVDGNGIDDVLIHDDDGLHATLVFPDRVELQTVDPRGRFAMHPVVALADFDADGRCDVASHRSWSSTIEILHLGLGGGEPGTTELTGEWGLVPVGIGLENPELR